MEGCERGNEVGGEGERMRNRARERERLRDRETCNVVASMYSYTTMLTHTSTHMQQHTHTRTAPTNHTKSAYDAPPQNTHRQTLPLPTTQNQHVNPPAPHLKSNVTSVAERVSSPSICNMPSPAKESEARPAPEVPSPLQPTSPSWHLRVNPNPAAARSTAATSTPSSIVPFCPVYACVCA